MSFSDPLSITYNGASKALVRVNQDFRGSEYYLDDGTEKYRFTIKHNVPSLEGAAGESHLARLDVAYYDSDGVYLRKESAWGSIRAVDAAQVTETHQYTTDALVGLLSGTGIVAKLLGREN